MIIYGPKDLLLYLKIYYIVSNTRQILLGEDVYDDVHQSSKYYDIDVSGVPELNKSTMFIKFIRYSGVANLTIYSDTNRSRTIPLGGPNSIAKNCLLTAEDRKQMNMSSKFSIAVSSSSIATYKLSV